MTVDILVVSKSQINVYLLYLFGHSEFAFNDIAKGHWDLQIQNYVPDHELNRDTYLPK